MSDDTTKLVEENVKPSQVEMAKIVLEVQNAIARDMPEKKRWLENYERERREWYLLAPEEQVKRKAAGSEFIERKPPVPKWVRNVRRGIRYKIFRAREGGWQTDPELAAIKTWYEAQLPTGIHFKDFTFEWDVSAHDPLKLITKIEWDGELLKVENKKDGIMCDPAAFTNQEI